MNMLPYLLPSSVYGCSFVHLNDADSTVDDADSTVEQVQLFDRHLSFIFSELMAEVERV